MQRTCTQPAMNCRLTINRLLCRNIISPPHHLPNILKYSPDSRPTINTTNSNTWFEYNSTRTLQYGAFRACAWYSEKHVGHTTHSTEHLLLPYTKVPGTAVRLRVYTYEISFPLDDNACLCLVWVSLASSADFVYDRPYHPLVREGPQEDTLREHRNGHR